jgi:hypothetical protein
MVETGDLKQKPKNKIDRPHKGLTGYTFSDQEEERIEKAVEEHRQKIREQIIPEEINARINRDDSNSTQ